MKLTVKLGLSVSYNKQNCLSWLACGKYRERYKVVVLCVTHACLQSDSLEFFTDHPRLVVLTGSLLELDHQFHGYLNTGVHLQGTAHLNRVWSIVRRWYVCWIRMRRVGLRKHGLCLHAPCQTVSIFVVEKPRMTLRGRRFKLCQSILRDFNGAKAPHMWVRF